MHRMNYLTNRCELCGVRGDDLLRRPPGQRDVCGTSDRAAHARHLAAEERRRQDGIAVARAIGRR